MLSSPPGLYLGVVIVNDKKKMKDECSHYFNNNFNENIIMFSYLIISISVFVRRLCDIDSFDV